MGHAIIDEFCRVYSLSSLQNVHFRRMQRVMRDEIQPLLDDHDRLVQENAALKAEIETLKTQKRGPGRPRKDAEAVTA